MKVHAFLFAVALLAGTLLFMHRLETGGDNLDFMLQARSAQQGEWRDVFSWYRPAGYALSVAATLALCGIRLAPGPLTVAGPTFHLVQAVGVVQFALAAVAVYVWARRVTRERFVAIGVALLFALNQMLVAWSSVIAAETLLVLLVFAALAVWEGTDHMAGGRWQRLALFAVLAGVALFVRTAAIALAGGFGLWIVVKRKWTGSYLLAACITGFFVLLAAVQMALLSNFYFTHVVAADPYGFGETVSWGERLHNAVITYTGGWPDLLFPKIVGCRGLFELTGLGPLAVPFTLAVFLLTLVGLARTLRRGLRLSHLFLLCYLVILLAWPDFLVRYMFPLAPVGLWLVLEGVAWLAERVSRGSATAAVVSRRATVSFVAVAAAWSLATNVFAGVKNWDHILELREKPPWDPARYAITGEDDFGDYITAGLWIKDHAPGDAVVFCRKALFIELVSGRFCRYYTGHADAEALWAAMTHAAAAAPCYILKDAFSTDSTYGRVRKLQLEPLLERQAGSLDEVHRTDYGSVIYRVADDPGGRCDP
ncbi:MAG: hypothetical protein V1929_05325 [bacterium]